MSPRIQSLGSVGGRSGRSRTPAVSPRSVNRVPPWHWRPVHERRPAPSGARQQRRGVAHGSWCGTGGGKATVRLRPVAPGCRVGGRQVSGVRCAGARLRPYPLRRLYARLPARVLVQVSLLLPELRCPNAWPFGRRGWTPRCSHRHGRPSHADRRAGTHRRDRRVPADARLTRQLASAPAPARHGRRVPARRDLHLVAGARHGAVDGGVPPRRAPVVRAPCALRRRPGRGHADLAVAGPCGSSRSLPRRR